MNNKGRNVHSGGAGKPCGTAPGLESREAMKLLITGIPGTGKTQFGDYLAAAHDFVHRDLELSEELAKFVKDPAEYLAALCLASDRVVISWGFIPAPEHIELVRSFRNYGFEIIWFDGDRPAALRQFCKRGTSPEEHFYLQMYRIENSKSREQVDPIVINNFDGRGEFKEPLGLYEEIKRALATQKPVANATR